MPAAGPPRDEALGGDDSILCVSEDIVRGFPVGVRLIGHGRHVVLRGWTSSLARRGEEYNQGKAEEMGK
jgi:hypothetical protein